MHRPSARPQSTSCAACAYSAYHVGIVPKTESLPHPRDTKKRDSVNELVHNGFSITCVKIFFILLEVIVFLLKQFADSAKNENAVHTRMTRALFYA